jgi:excisionase family DNA binding protein
MSIDADTSLGLFTIAEVAEILKVSIRTVRRLQQQRSIPFVKVGGAVRFTRNDLAFYLEKRHVRPIDE